jgi:four helix bundle protein
VRYTDWEAAVPPMLREDALWRRQDYRLALYAADLGWDDVRRLADERASTAMADQLSRALGSISANIAEGYGRSSGADRARFYEYALGSARESRDWYHKARHESRDWYHKARHVLGPALVRHRLKVLTSITRLLTAALPHERATSAAGPRLAVGHATRHTQAEAER